jgi:hypothetical protein
MPPGTGGASEHWGVLQDAVPERPCKMNGRRINRGARLWHWICGVPSFMKLHPSRILSAVTLSFLLSACEKEPEVVIHTADGKSVSVDKKDVAVVEAGKGPVIVKDTALIWPAVEETVRSQIKALNNEDLDAYMSYMHPDNPSYESTRQQLADLLEKYDLHYTLEKIEKVSVTEDEVKASFVQLTEKVSGPAFSNNRITGIHTLRKDNGKWKIFATTTSSLAAVDPVP